MYTKNFLAAGALLSAVAAVPMANKRDVVWETEVSVVVETVQATTTVWVDEAQATEAAATPSHYGHGHNSHHGHTTTVLSTSTVAPAPSSESSSYVAPTSESSSYVAQTPTSTYVAPSSSSTSVYVAPTTSEAPAPTSEAPAPTSEAPKPTTTEAATPSTYVQAAAATSASSGGSGDSTVHTGDMTYYTPGMGSCGVESSEGEPIVALSHVIMSALNGGNPNSNPLCGKTITISYDGAEHQATVVDTCPGCDEGSIDVTQALFDTVAPNGDGRVKDVSWWVN